MSHSLCEKAYRKGQNCTGDPNDNNNPESRLIGQGCKGRITTLHLYQNQTLKNTYSDVKIYAMEKVSPVNGQCCHCEDAWWNGQICNKVVYSTQIITEVPLCGDHIGNVRNAVKNHQSQVCAREVEKKIVSCSPCSSMCCRSIKTNVTMHENAFENYI